MLLSSRRTLRREFLGHVVLILTALEGSIRQKMLTGNSSWCRWTRLLQKLCGEFCSCWLSSLFFTCFSGVGRFWGIMGETFCRDEPVSGPRCFFISESTRACPLVVTGWGLVMAVRCQYCQHWFKTQRRSYSYVSMMSRGKLFYGEASVGQFDFLLAGQMRAGGGERQRPLHFTSSLFSCLYQTEFKASQWDKEMSRSPWILALAAKVCKPAVCLVAFLR